MCLLRAVRNTTPLSDQQEAFFPSFSVPFPLFSQFGGGGRWCCWGVRVSGYLMNTVIAGGQPAFVEGPILLAGGGGGDYLWTWGRFLFGGVRCPFKWRQFLFFGGVFLSAPLHQSSTGGETVDFIGGQHGLRRLKLPGRGTSAADHDDRWDPTHPPPSLVPQYHTLCCPPPPLCLLCCTQHPLLVPHELWSLWHGTGLLWQRPFGSLSRTVWQPLIRQTRRGSVRIRSPQREGVRTGGVLTGT